jgi:hypothetical protein
MHSPLPSCTLPTVQKVNYFPVVRETFPEVPGPLGARLDSLYYREMFSGATTTGSSIFPPRSVKPAWNRSWTYWIERNKIHEQFRSHTGNISNFSQIFSWLNGTKRENPLTVSIYLRDFDRNILVSDFKWPFSNMFRSCIIFWRLRVNKKFDHSQ